MPTRAVGFMASTTKGFWSRKMTTKPSEPIRFGPFDVTSQVSTAPACLPAAKLALPPSP